MRTTVLLRWSGFLRANGTALILRSGLFLGRVSKDGRESVRGVRPSRRLLRAALRADRCKLLRMRADLLSGSFAGTTRKLLQRDFAHSAFEGAAA
jgi:hypothetical protein